MKCSKCNRYQECKKKFPYVATIRHDKEKNAGEPFNRKKLVGCGE